MTHATDFDRPANRLAATSSPYLLLHAHTPVDWYPWGEEALARARAEGKPIFLSVGYSTCYWCHVMERESFSDPEIAAVMNERFVSVKVDREQRPDLDEIYMTATQLMTQHGGWPNSVFLTPDLEPFYAGTYFPPRDRFGRPGFVTILGSIAAAWEARRPDIERQAHDVAAAMRRYLEMEMAPADAPPGREMLERSLGALAGRFDAEHGGFGGAPKFPTPANLLLLLEAAEDPGARRMLLATLDAMARGGLWDQLGGGFHRYATDQAWRVPHFEKMLYDNGALLEIYARAHALAPDPELARIVAETVSFLDREMTAPEGAFWSAIDAETHGEEGAYYVWTRGELDAVLGAEDAAFLAPIYGFDGPPFFEEDRYVLHLPRPLDEQASRRRLDRAALLERIAPLRESLLETRDGRERPLTDDKILADWNGLAIAGLAAAAVALDRPSYAERAARAASFVLARLRDGEGRLLHAWRDGSAEIPAFLADYAYLVHGLLALHEATGERRWLDEAVRLADEQETRLAAPDGGWHTAAAGPDLIARVKELFDGASPSANGVAVLDALALAERTGEERFRERAERALRSFAPLLEHDPAAARTLAVAAARRSGGGAPAVTATETGGTRAGAVAALAQEARQRVTPALELGERSADGWQAFTLRLAIADGWHVQANPVTAAGLVPTAVDGEACSLREVRYPPGIRRELGFSDAPLAVWEGTTEVRGQLRREAPRAALKVTWQACDDARCLPSVTVELPVG